MLDFFQGKSPGPDSTIEEFQIDVEPAGVSDLTRSDRGGTGAPEVRLRDVVIIGFNQECGAVLDRQEIAQVLIVVATMLIIK